MAIIKQFDKRSGITYVYDSKSYYDKHRSDVCNKGATKENQDFRKSIDTAIENARRLKGSP